MNRGPRGPRGPNGISPSAPTIADNGNWIIDGKETEHPSYGPLEIAEGENMFHAATENGRQVIEEGESAVLDSTEILKNELDGDGDYLFIFSTSIELFGEPRSMFSIRIDEVDVEGTTQLLTPEDTPYFTKISLHSIVTVNDDFNKIDVFCDNPTVDVSTPRVFIYDSIFTWIKLS